LDHQAVREQTERVLADPLFRHSRRYSDLLRYIVDRTLKGRHDELKERIIGIEVFRRTPDYDTSLDPTVRVAANEVRKRLTLYYNETRHTQELRIDVPVRSYIAEFKSPEPALPLQVHPPEQPAQAVHEARVLGQPETTRPDRTTAEVHPPATGKRSRILFIGLPTGILVVALIGWAALRLFVAASAIDSFWAPVVNSGGQVLICIGSPPSGSSSNPQPSTAPGFAKPGMPFYEFSQQRVNVSMTDVTAANALADFLRGRGKDSIVRPAHGTSLSDLRANSAILLGSFHNEWATRLGSDLRYHFDKESDIGLRWIEDKNTPGNKTWSLDLSAPYEQVKNDYALISRVLDPTTGQWWIGIAGLTGLGTLAADRIVIDPKQMNDIGSRLPKGWEHKNLQVVVAIRIVEGSPGNSQVIATYSW
jgi:hypothetical protein